ncbi:MULTISPECIES: GGDEF domain-containing protein [unclassified Micromonospora]|uniref:GGDEF domain-containing protein n=1 Tax=unclassified Micromonospora TaxID=2617518 RepID=UPI001C600E22|nr:GGDEF domain-containing protein [Micromonospora sp. RL09-050-HVF-A]MBW4703328.1 GGDEF domain-containing protein [Micromonospora sp. RL09-050-HVF-A]
MSYLPSLTLALGLLLAVALVLVLVLTRYRRTVVRVTALHTELTTLRQALLRDPLSGLANRAGLTQAWIRLAPTRPHVAVIDLDGFKPVNDTHGHAAGDLVLTTVAGRLRTITTTAARLGGDEFAALIDGPDPAGVADRLARAIAAPIPLPTGITVTVTASIGLARTADDLPAALADADAAMYRAKTTRAAVAMFDPHRDDHTTPTPDIRPAVRVRDLNPITVTSPADLL